MNNENERIAQEFIDACNIADLKVMSEYLSDDFTFISPSIRSLDKETLSQTFPSIYEMIPDHRVSCIRMISQRNTVVMVANRTGTFKKGSYFGVEASNQRFEIPFINIFDFYEGKIKRWEAYWNPQLLKQSQQK